MIGAAWRGSFTCVKTSRGKLARLQPNRSREPARGEANR